MADVNLLIAFYSRNGSTEALAKHIASAAEAAGADVRLRRARDIVSEEVQKSVPGWFENATRMQREYQAPTSDDAEWADGILFGTPTRFGNVSAELKAYVDSLGGLWFQGKLFNKAAGVFVSTQSLHGGNEATSNSFFNPLAHLGFVIVPNGYGDPITFVAGTPYGSSTVSGPQNAPPTDQDLTVAAYQAKRVVAVARVLKPLRK